jgi:hypothetical protein
MSCSLPPELLDLIVDYLRNEPAVLKTCCVVSKSWLPRTRKHLFAHVEFSAPGPRIELWKKTFPDPSNSPACYTRSLSICNLMTIAAADADVGGWVRTFHRLVKLELYSIAIDDHQLSLVPFRGLSPTLKSLTLSHTCIPLREVFGLVCSFPLLEDLELISPNCRISDMDGWDAPSTSPKFTGSLILKSMKSIRPVVHLLCGLPDGLHFNKIVVKAPDEDLGPTMDLVTMCCDTLESFSISFSFAGAFTLASVFGPYPYRYL